jgi:hypothetical protein
MIDQIVKEYHIPRLFILPCRTIVLDVNAFDSKQRFIESLRIAYGSGTFFLGIKVSSSVVQSYYTYLKEDYEQNEIGRDYMEPEYMGYQGDNYWIISNDVRYYIHILQ